MINKNLKDYLLNMREEDGFFKSGLSDSPISTAIACVALKIADQEKYATQIKAAEAWLEANCNADGLYGDSIESPPNLTATYLAAMALPSAKRAKAYLKTQFGSFSFEDVKHGLLAEYGKDLTFSVPLLALATASGFFEDAEAAWRGMPRFPFEAAILPEGLFKYMNLPVVSYAIPALICVGLAQLKYTKDGILKNLRSLAVKKALRVLEAKQPEDGGFLEAAPLTGFCAICLCAADMKTHPVTQKALQFLIDTQRENGAWPIDRDLRQWVTTLALTILAPEFSTEEKAFYRQALSQSQTKVIHPFTRSMPGGWAWTTYSGGVPDADDTPSALIALHTLGEGVTPTVINGIKWLLDLQNRDGGIPTFCRGWGKLPFDRSCPDLTAHTFRAISLYMNDLPEPLQSRTQKAQCQLLHFLETTQNPDGSFTPLWFGDQLAADKTAPVYGSAVVLEHLLGIDKPFLRKTLDYLLKMQHNTGGWGSTDGKTDYVIMTARCVSALKPYPEAAEAVARGIEFLRPFAVSPQTAPMEPIGLYFAHLWYSEKLYAPIFLAKAVTDD
ncbi:MAG: hypothetical protein IKZ46_18825 [Victivallales bacterium]|nr:hypothetical protein [Victivallales bacterium]